MPQLSPVAAAIGLAVALILALAVTAWVFIPAFRGPEVARRAVGTHRLAFASIVVIVLFGGALSLPLAPFIRGAGRLTSTTFFLAATATEVPMVLFVVLRLVAPGAVSWRELGLRPLPLSKLLGYGVGAGVLGILVIEIALGSALSALGLRSNQLDEFQFVLTEGPSALLLLLFSAAIAAPIVEELFFRGFIFGMYKTRKPLWVAYVMSGLLFTPLHLLPDRMNISQMAGLSIGVFMLAMLLAWLYDQTNSLYPGMIAHAINNATGLIAFYLGSVH